MERALIYPVSPEADVFALAAKRPTARIDRYVWQQDYTPRGEAFLGCGEDRLRVCLTAWERTVRAEGSRRNDMVYLDSCLEFFFRPREDRPAYFNFEVNPHGTLYVGFSPDGTREGSRPIPDAPSNAELGMTARLCLSEEGESFWQVAYDVPYAFIRRFVPEFVPEGVLYANFYKCGDGTEHPHWGSWSPIETPAPDFHRPEFFGRLEFAK